jgi:CSLREA domain-containing protein
MLLLGWTRVIGFSIAASMVLATGAWAQVIFTVNTTDDGVDISPGDGNCSTVALPALPICTLRAAIMEANRAPAPAGGATIILHASASPYMLKIFPTMADGEADGDLNLIVPAGYNPPGPTTITGDGAANTIIDGNNRDRIFRIDAGRSVSISGVSMVNGLIAASDNGGGILNDGSLTLNDCIVSHNDGGDGGAIATTSVLNATGVTFSDNHSGAYGGAIQNNSGSVHLIRSTLRANTAGIGGGMAGYSGTYMVEFSTVADNTANHDGGGIALFGDASLVITGSTVSGNKAGRGGGLITSPFAIDPSNASPVLYVTNSTISQNQATIFGGGIYNEGAAKLYNSTIAYNQAGTLAPDGASAAGIWNASGKTFDLHNSILAGNRLVFDNSNSDCVGNFVLYGVIGYEGGEECFASTGYIILIDSAKELGILKNNGGTTETIALLPPSALIGNSYAEECGDKDGHHLDTDQRGNPRPPAGAGCDIGAFEYNELFRSSFDPPLP